MYDALISVIVPIYNVAPYLDRCVSSLVNQTYRNLEILLVDDGSTDESGQIADVWSARDPRIVVFHQEHSSVSSARNVGLDRARGQYLSFVDSDDFVDETFIQVLYETLVSNSVKMSIIGFQKFIDEKDIVVDRIRECKIQVLEGEHLIRTLFDGTIGVYVWNRLCASELYDGIRFPLGKLYEDAGTTHLLLAQCGAAAFCPAPLYFYRQRVGSIMHSLPSRSTPDRYEMHRRRYQDVVAWYPQLKINRTSFLHQIFESFPDLPPEIRVEATAEAAAIVKSFGREISLKTRLKFLAIRTVPNLYAWNKKRKKEQKQKHLARSIPR